MNGSPHSRSGLVGVAILASGLLLGFAQASQDDPPPRLRIQGLIGEIPDTSNWPHPAAPDGNPYPRSNASPEELELRDQKARLGKIAFWDEQFSVDNTMACGTCHPMSAGGTDNRLGGFADNGQSGSFGVIPHSLNKLTGKAEFGFKNKETHIERGVTETHTPTMVGAYLFSTMFWDRRAGPAFKDSSGTVIEGFEAFAALEDQAVQPPTSPIEMGHEGFEWGGFIENKVNEAKPLALVDPSTIPPDIRSMVESGLTYRQLFDKVFHNDPRFGGRLGLTRERFGMAVAHYMRTLIPDHAPIDLGTMSDAEVRGFDLIFRSGCFTCHSISEKPELATPRGRLVNPFDNAFTDGTFHDDGFGPVKTPTLRNVGLRAKFFHHGNGIDGENTLTALIHHLDDQLGDFGLDGSGPLGRLTEKEFEDVFAFFSNALTDPRVRDGLYPFDHPELASLRPEFEVFEGNEYGTATPGPSGTLPEILANGVPALLSSDRAEASQAHFKVGVGDALAGATAFLLVGLGAAQGPELWVGAISGLGPAVVLNENGVGTLHAPFPIDELTLGRMFFCQWMVLEPKGIAFSNAATFTPFKY